MAPTAPTAEGAAAAAGYGALLPWSKTWAATIKACGETAGRLAAAPNSCNCAINEAADFGALTAAPTAPTAPTDDDDDGGGGGRGGNAVDEAEEGHEVGGRGGKERVIPPLGVLLVLPGL